MKIVDQCRALVRVFVAVAAGALFMSAIAGPAAADGKGNQNGKPVLTFNGGIGVIPLVSVTGCPTTCVPNLNVVRGVTPGGTPWAIEQFNAQVFANGSIKVSGQGLVLAGGANPGQAPTPALSVLANLICQTAAGSPGPPPIPPTYQSSLTSTAGVTLSPYGDFQINDNLSPTPPVPCVSPVLLIQSTPTNHWFAIGVLSPNPAKND
jgi:hypothetical protein